MRTAAQAKEDRRQLWREIHREEKRKAREKLLALRGALRETRLRRKHALRDAKVRCRTERLAAAERARALRLRLLDEMREAVFAERAAARQACVVRLGDARGIKDDIERARTEWAAERHFQREMREIERTGRERKKHTPAASKAVRRSESDDEVRTNLSPELVPLFEKVKRQIHESPRMTRTEAFLLYAEQHPNEVLAVLDDQTDAMIRELEAQERKAARELRRSPPRRAISSNAEPAAADVPF